MIHPKNICIMLGVVILSWLVEGWRVKTIAYLLGEQIGFIDTLRINLATIFSGNITPLYSGSVPTQVYLLHQQGLSIGKASAIVTIRVTFTSLLVSIGGPLLLYIFRGKFLDEIGLAGLAGFLNYIILGALIFAGVLLLLLFRPAKGTFLIRRFFRLKLVQKILGTKAETLCQKLLTEGEEFRASLRTISVDKTIPVLFVVFLTFCSWISTLLIAPAVMMAFGVNIHGKILPYLALGVCHLFLTLFCSDSRGKRCRRDRFLLPFRHLSSQTLTGDFGDDLAAFELLPEHPGRRGLFPAPLHDETGEALVISGGSRVIAPSFPWRKSFPINSAARRRLTSPPRRRQPRRFPIAKSRE